MQNLKIFVVSSVATAFLATGALAQQVRVAGGDGVQVKNVEFQAQKTPNFQAGDVKNKNVPNPREWLEIEVEFEAAKVDPRDGVIPELLFRYYVGIMTETGQAVTLSGDVTHINVIAGEEYYSAVYVAPSTMGKLTGEFRRLDEGSVKAVGVEIFYNGVLVGGYSSQRAKFWEQTGTQQGILSREETPFALLWIDRYPEVKKQ